MKRAYKTSIQPKQVYGSWTVLTRATAPGEVPIRWLCRCKCGAEREVQGQSLASGRSRRCRECFLREARRTGKPRARKGRLSLPTGEEVSVEEAARRVGISGEAMRQRLKRWPPHLALTRPCQPGADAARKKEAA